MAFKFRHKVLIALCATVLLALGFFLGISLWQLQRSAEARVRQSLENAKQAFYLSREQQGKAVAEAVDGLAFVNSELRVVLAGHTSGEDPFAEGGGGDEKQVLESSLPFLPLYSNAAQFVVSDRDGNVVLAKDKALVPEGEAPVAVKEALTGKRSYDWWRFGARTLQVFSAPVTQGDQHEIVGTITVGYPLDTAYLQPLANISQTGIEVAPAGMNAPEEVSLVDRGGEKTLQSFLPISTAEGRRVGGFVVFRSLQEEMKEALALRNQLVALGAVVLLIAVALALWLASLVSRPLEAAVRAVKEIGGGNLKFRMRSTAADEFGTLGRAIDDMAAGLEERERIRATFNRYVDDEVVNEVLNNQASDSLSGEEREISILFADLANFTSFSEGKTPTQLLSDLNTYFGEMSRVVSDERGILDKFIGDAIMAYWGAPLSNPRHAEHACRAALAQATLFREKFLPAYPGLGLRIGVSTGLALVGNVGSEQRQNYTVMGDTVNLASRLEGVNKAFGTMICVSAATREAVGENFVFRLLGNVKVAGRSEAEPVFELMGEAGHPGVALAKSYEEALALFEAGDLEASARLAEGLAQDGDGPSKALLTRCREGLGPSWTASWSLSK